MDSVIEVLSLPVLVEESTFGDERPPIVRPGTEVEILPTLECTVLIEPKHRSHSWIRASSTEYDS